MRYKILLIPLAFVLVLSLVYSVSAVNLTSNLVSYYKLDEGSGNIAIDSLGYQNGTEINGPVYVQGKIGPYALNFSSTNSQWINLSNAAAMNGRTNFTVQAWINMSAQSTDSYIWAKDTGGVGGLTYRLRTVSNQILWEMENTTGGDTSLSSTNASYLNNWLYVVGTFNGTYMQLYVNAVPVANGSFYGTPNTQGNASIGRRDSGGYAQMMIDEPAYWNRTLNYTEISQLYNQGGGIQYPFNEIITLDNPAYGAIINTAGYFNATANSGTNTLINATLYLYDNSGNLIATNYTTSFLTANKINFTRYILNDGTYEWNIKGGFNDGKSYFATANFTYIQKTSTPSIIFTSPINSSYIYPINSSYANLNMNVTIADTYLSVCYWNSTWDSTIHLYPCNIAQTLNLTNIFGKQTIYVFANDTVGNIGMNQSTFSIAKASFNATTAIGNTEGFNLNVSYFNNPIIAQVNLIYNNSAYTTLISSDSAGNIISSKQLTIPSFNATSAIPFYWNTIFANGTIINSSIYNQTVTKFSLDNCGTNTILLMNLTTYDQDSLSLINATAQNETIETLINLYSSMGNVLITTYNASYNNVNNAKICIPTGILNTSNYLIDYQIRFYGNSYAVQYINGQQVILSSSTIPLTIPLYDLLLTRSQEFKVTYKDGNLLPVSNALIQVTRQYIPQNNFFTVESPSTDANGQAIVHLVLGDVIYTIQVTKNGQVLAVFNNVVASCTNIATGDCTLDLNAIRTTVVPLDFSNYQNINYYFNWTRSSNLLQFIFNTQDTSNQNISWNVIKNDNLGNTTLCSSSLITSAGTLSCTINPATYGNVSFLATAYYNGNQIALYSQYMGPTPGDTFGGTRVIIGLLLYSTLVLLFITNPVAIIIGAFLGVIFAMLLFIVDGGSFIGNSSVVLWFFIAGGIIIWQITRQNKQ